MASIGQKKNYKDKKRMWLTSGLAQAMVLLNGLIITITAFLVFSYFINNMSIDEYRRTSDEAGKSLVDGISSLENSMRLVSSIIELSESHDYNFLLAKIRHNVANLGDFDQLLWIYEKETGGADFKVIAENNGNTIKKANFHLVPNRYFVDHLIRTGLLKDDKLKIVYDLRGMEYFQESISPNIAERSFAFIKTVRGGSTRKGIVVGVSRAALLFNQNLISENKSILKFTIYDKESGQRLFHMDRSDNTSKRYDKNSMKQEYNFFIANRQWDIILQFSKKKNVILLEKIPYIILFFGLVLTFVGTLFVHNNNKQAQKLADINRKLEQKNYELQSEISERSRLNEALVISERDNRAIIDAVSDVIFETDIEGTVKFLSAAWQNITGFEVERSRGNNLFSMLHPQDQERQRSDFERLIRGQKQAYRVFTRLRISDGTFRAIELAISMIRQDENKNLRVVGTITDVEERRRAERALAEAEKKYRTIVENAAGGLYQLTPEGMYLSANPAMARILGYDSPEEMLRTVKNAGGMVYPDIEARKKFIQTLITQGNIFGYETQVIRKDGSKIWVRENIRVVKDELQNVIYFEGSMEDITQRKEADFALMEAKIQSDMASRAKSEFIANMSHELRTPLNTIIGFSDIMIREAKGPLGQEIYKEYAIDINNSGKGLLKIINEILDISKIETGKKDLSESEFAFESLVNSTIELYDSRLNEKDIILLNRCSNLPRIIGEELSIKQVIGNIYSNAIKYTPDGGRITLFTSYDTDGVFRFSITDTGVGMNHDEINKAFSPFGQLDNSLNRSSSGAGLGLSLSKAIMNVHDGEIEILSEKSIGTTVTLIFPAYRVIKDTNDNQEERNTLL